MRTVFLDPGSYDCLNFGDLAMLQVAIARWTALWPSASIAVLTCAPEAFASYGPRVVPVDVRDRAAWLNARIAGRFHRALPSRAAATLDYVERGLKLDAARSLEAALALRRRIARTNGSDAGAFLHWLRRADVVALTGGGALTDAFSVKASQILATLGMAVRRRRRVKRPVTAIFGQGFGPLDDPALRGSASEVLPGIDLIALRENRASAALLTELGVPQDRVVLTGDDAIELVFDNKASHGGDGLGVNVRVAYYARTDSSTLGVVKQVVSDAARRYGAPLVPVPISRQRGGTQPHNAEQSDAASIRRLLTDAAVPRGGWSEPHSPADVIREVGRCRMVVTGSYHGAVFALAQGIPAIGLVGSEYYRAKFVGLAQQFKGGVRIVEMGEVGWGSQLAAAIADLWPAAERLRPSLLEAAARQIELSRGAYGAVASAAAATPATPPGGAASLMRAQTRELEHAGMGENCWESAARGVRASGEKAVRRGSAPREDAPRLRTLGSETQ